MNKKNFQRIFMQILFLVEKYQLKKSVVWNFCGRKMFGADDKISCQFKLRRIQVEFSSGQSVAVAVN